MSIFKKITEWFQAHAESKKLENWFFVSWDGECIYRNVSPPGRKAWSDKFQWSDINCICFESTDYMYSDDIYFFTTERPESYVVPVDATGGAELWEEVLNRGLFDAELAIRAATTPEGMFCWPEPED